VHSTFMETMVWLRVPGDIVFSVGALFLAVYALRLLRRPTQQRAAELAVPAGAKS
jgi:nitric oxide reductase subunit B